MPFIDDGEIETYYEANQSNFMQKTSLVGCLGLIVSLFIAFIVITSFTGLHMQTGEGQHVGYVTATSTHGIFFKTSTAYVKTDTQSSQEDSYCVIDKNVLRQLQDLSDAHAHVQVHFISYFSAGIANCSGEGDIITGAQVIQ